MNPLYVCLSCTVFFIVSKSTVFKSEFLNCLEKLDYLVVLDVHGSNMQGFDRIGAS